MHKQAYKHLLSREAQKSKKEKPLMLHLSIDY
jgi:hypothetical protein